MATKEKRFPGKFLKAFALALAMAVLLGVLGAIVAEQDSEGVLLTICFFVGLVFFTALLFRVDRPGFWFSLLFALEWALLPVAAAINTGQVRETGCSGFAAAIGATLFLALTIPIGALGFVIFLVLALVKFRRPAKPQLQAPETTGLPGSDPPQ